MAERARVNTAGGDAAQLKTVEQIALYAHDRRAAAGGRERPRCADRLP